MDPDGYLADLAGGISRAVHWRRRPGHGPGQGWPGVYVGFRERAWPPGWLVLRPRNLVAGVGCHKGTPAQEILEFIKDTFRQERLSLASLKALATIEAKKEEPGLQAGSRQAGSGIHMVYQEELQNITVPHPSPQVARLWGW